VGEADLIALDRSGRYGETLAFVEVKTRRSDRHTDPQSAVDADKQRRLRRIADYYLNRHDADGLTVRFDIVSVVMPEGEKPRVEHIADAF
jgi:putative endonuclease